MNSQGRRIYRDDSKRLWFGGQCPTCRYGNMRPDGRNGVEASKKNAGKKCKCGRLMPVTRYFQCDVCKPYLDEDPGEAIYN